MARVFILSTTPLSLVVGHYFGEVALTASGSTRRTASVISHTVLWLQRLNKADVHEIGRIEPILLYTLRRQAIARRRELGEELRSAATVFTQEATANAFSDKMRRRATRRRKIAKVEDSQDPGGLQKKHLVKGVSKVLLTVKRHRLVGPAPVAPASAASEVSTTTSQSPTATWTCATPPQAAPTSRTQPQPSDDTPLSPRWDDDYGLVTGEGGTGADGAHSRVGVADDDDGVGGQGGRRKSLLDLERRTSDDAVDDTPMLESSESLDDAPEEDEVGELMSLVGELQAHRQRLADDQRKLEQLENHVRPARLERVLSGGGGPVRLGPSPALWWQAAVAVRPCSDAAYRPRFIPRVVSLSLCSAHPHLSVCLRCASSRGGQRSVSADHLRVRCDLRLWLKLDLKRRAKEMVRVAQVPPGARRFNSKITETRAHADLEVSQRRNAVPALAGAWVALGLAVGAEVEGWWCCH